MSAYSMGWLVPIQGFQYPAPSPDQLNTTILLEYCQHLFFFFRWIFMLLVTDTVTALPEYMVRCYRSTNTRISKRSHPPKLLVTKNKHLLNWNEQFYFQNKVKRPSSNDKSIILDTRFLIRAKLHKIPTYIL